MRTKANIVATALALLTIAAFAAPSAAAGIGPVEISSDANGCIYVYPDGPDAGVDPDCTIGWLVSEADDILPAT